jgi:hypothetical protein
VRTPRHAPLGRARQAASRRWHSDSRARASARDWSPTTRDNRGYVYEKAVITQYINAKLKTTPNASGAVDSPNIGACACMLARRGVRACPSLRRARC